VEAIEHFEYGDRIKILDLIKNIFVPKYLYLTTPNIEFNKFYSIEPGSLRRRDHCVEYTKDQFSREVVSYLSDLYNIEYIDIIEPTEEFENMQPIIENLEKIKLNDRSTLNLLKI
jgi:hypothetical protein